MVDASFFKSSDRIRIAPTLRPHSNAVCLRAPGSKSHSTRALVLRHLTGDETDLRGCSSSTDARVLSAGLRGLRRSAASIDAADGGAPGRFLMAVAAATGVSCSLDGSARLRERPFAPLIEAVRSLGATVSCQGKDGHLPLDINGRLTENFVRVDSRTSSQFASALLLVGPVLPCGLEVAALEPVSDGYLDLTVEVMRAFGADIEEESLEAGRLFQVGSGFDPPSTYDVPADVSGAAFLWLAGVVGPTPISVALAREGSHPDLSFLDCLEAMGADVVSRDGVTTVGGDLHRGGTFDLSSFPDSACALGIAAAVNPEPVTITGASHLRLKESDRIQSMVDGLTALGLEVTASDDGFHVAGGKDLAQGCLIPSHDDHRVAMAFATLGARHTIMVGGVECVDKSFPEFFETLSVITEITQNEDAP